MGNDSVAVQQHLTTTAQCHAGRCTDHREISVLHFIQRELALFQNHPNGKAQVQACRYQQH